MGQLDTKVAIVTGSGLGQGFVAAGLFAKEGARIVVNDLDAESVDVAVASIKDAGREVTGAVGDVSLAADVQATRQAAQNAFGGLDILYDNAGIGYLATQRFGIAISDVVNCTEDDWHRVLDINVGGIIINTTSIAALRGGADAHAYTASKGAILALTRAVAVTYGPKGILANTHCSGVIDTEMIHATLIDNSGISETLARNTPLKRNGTPGEVADVALFLASDQSRFVTGEAFALDGGIIQSIGLS